MRQSAQALRNRAAADARQELGTRLRLLREEKDYAITTLASLTGISPNTIRAIERGQPCHQSSIHRILQALETDAPPATDRPLLHEDLDIAVLYHDAPTALRNYIAQLLRAREYATWKGPDPKLLAFAQELMQLSPLELEGIQVLTAFYRDARTRAAGTSTSTRRQRKPDKNK